MQHQWLGLTDVARRYDVARTTVWAWSMRGCRPTGSPDYVRLRCERVGGRWKTTQEWLDEFQAKLNGTGEIPSPVAAPSKTQRTAAATASSLEARLGVMRPGAAS